MRYGILLAMVMGLALGASCLAAQLNGNYTIISAGGGSYTDIGAAFTDLETQGVSGPVVFDVTGTFTSSASYQLGYNGTAAAPVTGVSATNTITFRAATGQQPVINGGGASPYFFTASCGVYVSTSFVTFDGLEFAGAPDCGIFVFDGAGNTGVTVRNCRIHGVSAGPGIVASGNSSTATVSSFVAENNFIWDCTAGGTVGGFAGGIWNGAIGMALAGANCSINNNTILHNSGVAGSSAFFYGVFVAGLNLANFSDNIVVSTSSSGASCFGCTPGEEPTTTDYNLYFFSGGGTFHNAPGTYANFAAWQGGGFDTNGLNSDPLLVSTATGSEDLHLQTGSPAIDAGDPASGLTDDIDGDSRPAGAAIEIGADEIQVGGDPEINLLEGSTSQPDGSTQNIGDQTTGVASTGNFTIQNLGSTMNLNITSISATATGVGNCNVSATALSPASPIAAGGSATFDGMVTPITDGPFEFTLVIVNNDADEGTYTVIYQGNGVSPEISIERPAGTLNTIADGGSDTVNGTVDSTLTTVTYTVRNSGTQVLTLPTTSVSTTNASNCTAVVTSQPGTSIGIGATATFTIDVTPGAAGGWSFEIDVLSDDSDEANYDIAVSGTAAATPTPQLEVSRTGTIASGGTDSAFGSVISTPLNLTYTVTNVGSALLTFTGGTPVAVTAGTGAPAIGTITQPGATIAAGSNDTFAVTITPGATAGAWTANVTIASDDPASPYTFTISGTSQATAAPEIAVVDSSNTDIANGSTYAESATGTANFNRTFNVQNQGASALTLTPSATPVVIGALSNCNVTVTSQPASSIAAASSSPFILSITPTAAGGFSFTVTIANDDGDENPFVFTYSGNTAAGGSSSGGGGGGGGSCSTGSTSSFSWMALLGLLSALVVFTRVRGSKA